MYLTCIENFVLKYWFRNYALYFNLSCVPLLLLTYFLIASLSLVSQLPKNVAPFSCNNLSNIMVTVCPEEETISEQDLGVYSRVSRHTYLKQEFIRKKCFPKKCSNGTRSR